MNKKANGSNQVIQNVDILRQIKYHVKILEILLTKKKITMQMRKAKFLWKK